MVCQACGTENTDGAKFCHECGAPMSAPALGTERKVVSVIFCDLVGFTSRSESADPEDVLATVRPYHALLRKEIESFGGTVEKFIGDAVMAVFGAPIAHEDDAERAVRAGLRILESLEELNQDAGLDLSVRVGINTGEAVVSLSARPERGEGIVTGDVVNTAARIQTGAPVGGVAVGGLTHRLTAHTFDYEPLDPIAAKGKSEDVPAWQAIAPRARFGTDIARRPTTELVGREVEVALLRGLFERSVRDRSCQLVTIVGEPGVGKSRLVAELAAYIDERPELITWRQGRCLPYGDGIAFWALGEIVKAHAGILESDSVEDAGGKLDRTLAAAEPLEPGEREWLHARLAPLVGAEASGEAQQEEAFAAWRRFLEVMAGSDPIVCVFEDLHWADPAMLSFIEHLADWTEGVAMLLVGTARPELAETHPGWGTGLRNATTMNLAPLSEQETARLVGALLGQVVLPVDVQGPILERAGGNPLYAEEFIRMLRDRGILEQRGRSWELAIGSEIPAPESIHGLIAARLDTLAPAHKSLLQDAAVLGKVFWVGALGAMSGRDQARLLDDLHELSRKEFVRAARQPSMEGEREYAFWHMLVRDVVYGQIPRAERAAKHVAAAEWIEGRVGERSEDLSDVLAYHYAEAVDLADASGTDVDDLRERALRVLVMAAQRAMQLDTGRATELYERALEVAPSTHPTRPEILVELAEVVQARVEYARAEELLDAAISAFDEAGDPVRSAATRLRLARVRGFLDAAVTHRQDLLDAVAVLERYPPGPDLVAGYAQRASFGLITGGFAAAADDARRSIELSRSLGLPDDVTAIRVLGWSRSFSGDLGGMGDVRSAIELARQRGQLGKAAHALNDLGLILGSTEGTDLGLVELRSGEILARTSGNLEISEFIRGSSLPELLYAAGSWDEAIETAAPFLEPEREVDRIATMFARSISASISTWRDELPRASALAGGLAEDAIEISDTQVIVSALGVSAHLAVALGDATRALELLQRLDTFPSIRLEYNYPAYLPEIVRVALWAGGPDLAARLADDVPDHPIALHRAARGMVEAELAEAQGDLERAVRAYTTVEAEWRRFSAPERAQALLGRGRCLLALGDPSAIGALSASREGFASLGADRFLPEVDQLIESALGLSS
jgi:class 3 adenylate cyclase/tetratricopeptide (TPR) repeat protein